MIGLIIFSFIGTIIASNLIFLVRRHIEEEYRGG